MHFTECSITYKFVPISTDSESALTRQADMFPKIYANLSNLSVRIPQSWIRTLLVEWIPFEAVCRLWDQIMLEGDGYLFRAMLAIIAFLEPR